jgi:hypothetical protein
MAYGQYIQEYGINGLTGENPHSPLTTADAGGKRFLTAGTVVSGRLSEPDSSTSVPASTFCSHLPSVYNNGNMWLHWLTGGIEYDLITASKEEIAQMEVQEKLSLFFKNLRSKNAENLYLTNLVKFYFSNPSSIISDGICPHIGLWSRPPIYVTDEFGNKVLEGYENGNFKEQTVHHTFCISDRYNWAVRTNFHIDGKLLDKYGGNPNRTGETIPSGQQLNQGGTIFYFDEYPTNLGKDIPSTAFIGQTIVYNNKVVVVSGVLPGLNGTKVYESTLPAINSTLDYNMPLPRDIDTSKNVTFQEAVRLPYNFYSLTVNGEDKILPKMFMKSNELTFTQHFVDDYGDNHK